MIKNSKRVYHFLGVLTRLQGSGNGILHWLRVITVTFSIIYFKNIQGITMSKETNLLTEYLNVLIGKVLTGRIPFFPFNYHLFCGVLWSSICMSHITINSPIHSVSCRGSSRPSSQLLLHSSWFFLSSLLIFHFQRGLNDPLK